MRSKLLKILSVLVAVIIAVSCCCISASAAEASTNINSFSEFFDFNSAFFFYLRDGSSADPSSITSTDWVNYSDYVDCDVNGNTLTLKLSGDTNWGQWQWYKVTCSFNVKENYRIKAYSNGTFSIRVDDSTSVSFLNNNYLPNVLYKFGSFDTLSSNLQWEHYTKLNAVIPRNVEIGSFKTISLDFYFYGKKTILATDTIKFNFGSLNVSLIDETQQMVNTIVQNQNENADKIMQNQNENTDKILNGDSDLDSSGETGKVDGAIGSVDDATNNALGGKSEQDIQNEVSGALDTDSLEIDYTKAQRMSTFYDRCLKSFGKDYNALLLLSLILGLSAFLIGRRYG